MKKRIMSLLMALTLCLSLLPTMALAKGSTRVDVTEKEVFSGSGKSTVTLKGTIPDDNGGTKNVVLHFELDVEYESKTTYSTGVSGHITLASAKIDGVNAGAVTGATIRLTKAKSGGLLEIVADMAVGEYENYPLFARWDNYQEHDDVKFEPWSDRTALPTEVGNYYLYDDVTLTDTWNVPTGGTTNLCLNGHVIKQTATASVITVNDGATLNLYDCCDDYDLPHFFTYSKTGAWTYVPEPQGTFEPVTVDQITDATEDGTMVLVKGGCITGGVITGGNTDYGSGVFVYGGTFTMNAGSIVGNQTSTNGGGVYVDNYDIGAKLLGGEISGNTAGDIGGGVCCNRAITVGGDIQVKNNTSGSEVTDNVYLRTTNKATYTPVVDISTLTAGASIGISSDATPTTATPVTIVNCGSDCSNYFFSDSADYYVKHDSSQLKLYAPADGQHTITVLPAENGVVYTNKQVAEANDTVTLTVSADSGYTLKSLKYNDGEDHDITSAKTFSMPTGKNVTVTPEFAKLYPIWIGNINDEENPGIQVTEGDVLGDGTVIYTPDADEPDTKGTLTLNGAKLFTDNNDDVWYGIQTMDDDNTVPELTIELIGDNQIGKDVTYDPDVIEADDYSVENGIEHFGNITFTGKGTLTIYAGDAGICATSGEDEPHSVSFGTEENPFEGTVTIESCDDSAIYSVGGVTVTGGTVDVTCYGENSDSIVAYGGVTITGDDTKVTVVNEGYAGSGILVGGDVTVTGGEVSVTSQSFGLGGESGGKVTISGGKVDITTNWMSIYSASVAISGDDTEVTAAGDVMGIGAGSVAISGGKVDVTSSLGYGIYSQTSVTISGDKTDVTVETKDVGIYGGTYVDISGGTVDVASSDKTGITSSAVRITGGTVTATSNADSFNGIAAENGNVTISGGNVTATGGNVGILAKNVSITGGNVTGNGGIMAYHGALTITGGTVKAKSESAAIIVEGYDSGALTIGSEAAPLKIKNAMRMRLNEEQSYVDDTAITEGMGALALPVTVEGTTYVGALRALDNTGYVTIGEVEQPAPSSGGDYTPTVTIPVAGDKDSVKVQATVSGSTAKIKNVTDEQLDKVGTGKEVTVDLSSLNKSVTGVTFPKTTLENIAESEASGLEVKLPGGTTAVFDKTTVAAIAEQAAGRDIQLVIDTTLKAAQVLTGAQKSAIQGMKSALVLEAYFTSNGKRISNFKGGEAELTVSYPTTKPVRVWYLTEAGALEEVPSSFDGKSASFVVKHFSNYVIEQLDGSSYASCPQDATCVYAKFTDANTRAWYHDGVHYCVENGMMNGVGNDLFAPGATLTRGMVVTMLARLSGVDTATNGVWYVPGQEWAVANGISDGTNMTANITREQLATMLYRYALLKGIDTAKFT